MPYFRAFSAFSVTVTFFMNSITFVMNHLISYFDISICHCSNRTLCYHLFKFHGFNHDYFLDGMCSIQLSYWDMQSLKNYDIYLTKQTLESQGGVKNYRTICWDRAVRVFSGAGRKFKYKCMKKKFFYLKQITL